MAIAIRLFDHLEQWLKFAPRADVTHCVLRFEGLFLVSYCDRKVEFREASKPVLGARHCTECEILRNRRAKGKLKAEFRKGNNHVAAGK